MKRFQIYVVNRKKQFSNITVIVAKSAAMAIREARLYNTAPRSMGRVQWRAEEVK